MSPCGKEWFNTKAEAQRKMESRIAVGRLNKQVDLLNAYYCERCEGWHLGHNYLLAITHLCVGECR